MTDSRKKAMGRRVLVTLTIILLVQLLLTSVSSASSGQCVYTVRRGDTLFSIARRFGTTVNAIVQANCICNPNLIFAGQCLVIPVCCQPVCVPVCPTVCPTPCQTACTAACSTCCMAACPVTCPTTCPVTCPTICPTGCTHIVQRGETLTGIAARFGTTVFALMRLNGICNPNLIFVGQCLRVC